MSGDTQVTFDEPDPDKAVPCGHGEGWAGNAFYPCTHPECVTREIQPGEMPPLPRQVTLKPSACISFPPRDCSDNCSDGPCDCSGEWRNGCPNAAEVERLTAAIVAWRIACEPPNAELYEAACRDLAQIADTWRIDNGVDSDD